MHQLFSAGEVASYADKASIDLVSLCVNKLSKETIDRANEQQPANQQQQAVVQVTTLKQ